MSRARLIRARLRALIARHATTPTDVAKALGKSPSWLTRKLAKARPLSSDDVDAILGHLGEPPEVLDAAVLVPGDLGLLLGIRAGDCPAHTDAVERLRSQDLIRIAGEGYDVTLRGERYITQREQR